MLDSPTTSYLTYVYSATASIKINQYKYINKKQKYLKPEKKKRYLKLGKLNERYFWHLVFLYTLADIL